MNVCAYFISTSVKRKLGIYFGTLELKEFAEDWFYIPRNILVMPQHLSIVMGGGAQCMHDIDGQGALCMHDIDIIHASFRYINFVTHDYVGKVFTKERTV